MPPVVKECDTARDHIRKLARIAFPHTATERWMCMFTVYLDESGTHGKSPVVVVAGYLSTDDQWAKFSEEWQSVLQDYKLDCFHMTDFENRKGPFKTLTNAERFRLLEKLIAFIKIRQRIGLAVAFHASDYKEIVEEFQDEPIKKPYSFCALLIMVVLKNWLITRRHNEVIAYVYESGALHAGEIMSGYQYWTTHEPYATELRAGSLTFGSKSDLVPLQAADILAYETWKDITNTIAGSPRKPRWPMVQLCEAPVWVIRVDKDKLREILTKQANRGKINLTEI